MRNKYFKTKSKKKNNLYKEKSPNPNENRINQINNQRKEQINIKIYNQRKKEISKSYNLINKEDVNEIQFNNNDKIGGNIIFNKINLLKNSNSNKHDIRNDNINDYINKLETKFENFQINDKYPEINKNIINNKLSNLTMMLII